MGEPARKLDRDVRPAAATPRDDRPGRVLYLPAREAAPHVAETWVLEQIVLWYRSRSD